MCCLFGIIDYNQTLTAKQLNKIIAVLSKACEVRGTDATGISYNYIVNDFYSAQKHLDMTKRRRLFHFVLSTPAAKDMERTLSEGAEVLLEYFEALGHQVLLVPDSSSNENHYNYHWHVVVNSVSSITGKVLSDSYSTYNSIIHCLNTNTCTLWSCKYK